MDNRTPRPPRDFIFDWFAWYNGWREGRQLKIHHLRDGPNMNALRTALEARGGRFGKTFVNGPISRQEYAAKKRQMKALVEAGTQPLIEDAVTYRHVDISFLGPGRTVVVPGRLGMDDMVHADKVHVQPAFTTPEQIAIREVRRYVERLSRCRAVLSDPIAAQLPPQYADRAVVYFRSHRGRDSYLALQAGKIARRHDTDQNDNRTLAYLLYLPAVESLYGADLLVTWGPGGTTGLAFAHRLGKDMAHLLGRYGFTMVEVTPTASPQLGDSGDFDFFDDWGMQVVLQAPVLEAALPLRKARKPSPASAAPGAMP